MRLAPGIAAVVSRKIRSGCWPETKVSEQRMLATKPVAIFGTSRARAADSASALSAVVVARMRSRFRRVTFRLNTWASGMTHQRVASHVGERGPLRSPDFEIGLAETFGAS